MRRRARELHSRARDVSRRPATVFLVIVDRANRPRMHRAHETGPAPEQARADAGERDSPSDLPGRIGPLPRRSSEAAEPLGAHARVPAAGCSGRSRSPDRKPPRHGARAASLGHHSRRDHGQASGVRYAPGEMSRPGAYSAHAAACRPILVAPGQGSGRVAGDQGQAGVVRGPRGERVRRTLNAVQASLELLLRLLRIRELGHLLPQEPVRPYAERRSGSLKDRRRACAERLADQLAQFSQPSTRRVADSTAERHSLVSASTLSANSSHRSADSQTSFHQPVSSSR